MAEGDKFIPQIEFLATMLAYPFDLVEDSGDLVLGIGHGFG
jgi:hypothetical protein